MTAVLILFGYAGMLGLATPRLMERFPWQAAPRLAIGTWFALAASFVLALVFAGFAIVMPFEVHVGAEGAFVRGGLAELWEHWGVACGSVLGVFAALLTWAVPGRLAVAAAAVTRSTVTERARLHQALASAATDRNLGVAVVGSDRPAAYCVAGRGGLVVVTSGALALLSDRELEAVVAHERAHLQGRHHLLVLFAQAMRRAFGAVPLFAVLPEQIGRLVELAADDAAVRESGRRSLASGLLRVAAAQTPAPSLAASGGDTVARIERLLEVPPGPGPAGVGTILGGSAAALVAPFLIAAVPIVTAVGIACCHA